MQTTLPPTIWPTTALVVAATITDLRSRRIPNWLVLPFLLMGLLVSALSRGWSGLEQSALGVLLAGSVLGVFCWLGGLGMGDLKLYSAIGAWIGPSQLGVALVMTGLVGGVMALCWALADGFLAEMLRSTAGLIFRLGTRGLRRQQTLTLENPATRKMPYAPAIAIGTILSFLGRQS